MELHMTRGILVQDMGKLWERKEVVECSYTLLRVVQLILSVPEVKLVGSLDCNKFVTSCIVVTEVCIGELPQPQYSGGSAR